MVATYFFAFTPVAYGLGVVEALGIAMAIIDDVATDDGGLAVESVATKSRPTDAHVTAAGLVRSAGGVDVTVVDFVTSGLFLFFYDCTKLQFF